MSFSITIDDHEVRVALERLAHQGQTLRPVLKSIGQVLVSVTDLAFRAQADPWGGPWAGLKDTTLKRRRGGPRQGAPAAAILRDLGILQNSFSAQVQDTEVRFGTADIRAGTHQFGAKQGAYGRTKRNGPIPWGDIPPRPFMPIRGGAVDLPADDRADILDLLRRHFEGG